MIEIRLFATFRIGRDKILYMDSRSHQNIQQVLDDLQIDARDVSILLINGIHSKPESAIKDGDVVSLFPPVGGG